MLDFPELPMPTADRQAFGEWLKAIRTTAGLTQRELAAAVGTDGPHVIAWEKGRNVPGGMKLVAILRACGVKIVAAAQPPAVPVSTAAGLVVAVEALSRQMAALAEAAARLDRLDQGDDEAGAREEASG